MAIVKPFKAVRPTKEKAAAVAALPYDVYSREEARDLVRGDYDTFLRVDRPESTMDPRISIYDPAVYRQAKRNLDRLYDRGLLVQDDKPAFYVYELIMDGRSQIGLVATTSVDEYLNQTIKKHELTRADKEVDRINHVDATDANTGPIFLAYRGLPEINVCIEEAMTDKPIFDFTADDGVTHRGWMITDASIIDRLEKAFSGVESLYIADGHHRTESAVKVGLKRREEHPGYTGDEEFNYFLSVLFPDEQLKILDYNRVVADLNGLTVEALLSAIKKAGFEIEDRGNVPVKPEKKGTFGMVVDNRWYLLTVKDGIYDANDPVASLDVAILQDKILIPILGIGDIRTDKRIDFVGGIRGLDELSRRADSDMKLAFSMYPTSIHELMDIADAGLIMPPKSTWFEPKLRSGLFIHKLDD